MPLRAWILLLTTALTWGSSFMFMKIALHSFSPAQITVGRSALGVATIAAILAIRGILRREGRVQRGWQAVSHSRPLAGPSTRRHWVGIAAGGVLLTIPFTLIAWAEQHVDSIIAGMMMAAVPLFSTVASLRYDQQHRTTPQRIVGMMVGFCGVAVLLLASAGHSQQAGAAAHSEASSGTMQLIALVGLLITSMCYSSSSIVARQTLADVDPVRVAAWTTTVPVIVLGPLAVWQLRGIDVQASSVAAMVALGVIASGVGVMTFYMLLSIVGAARAGLVNYLLPPLSVMYGSLVLSEQIPPVALVGMCIIFVGILLGSRSVTVTVDGAGDEDVLSEPVREA